VKGSESGSCGGVGVGSGGFLEGWEGDHEDDEDPPTRTLSSRATSVLLTTGRTRNLAEHAGFSHDDTNVILMLSTGLSRVVDTQTEPRLDP
jgi:hypothetical protein